MALLPRPPVITRITARPSQQPDVLPNPLPLFPPPAVVQAPFAEENWPSLLRARSTITVDPERNNAILAPVVVAAPFAEENWPSLLRGRTVPTDQFANRLPLQTGVVDTFSQEDWPSVTRARPAPPTIDPPRNALLFAQPFVQYEWPSIRLRGYGVWVEQQPNLLPAQNPPVAADPFVQEDWPLTARSGRIAQHDAQANFLPLTFVAGDPFRQTDWLNLLRPGAVQPVEPPPFFDQTTVTPTPSGGGEDYRAGRRRIILPSGKVLTTYSDADYRRTLTRLLHEHLPEATATVEHVRPAPGKRTAKKVGVDAPTVVARETVVLPLVMDLLIAQAGAEQHLADLVAAAALIVMDREEEALMYLLSEVI